MYEERPRRSLLKEFIMKLILIIIFVLLLLWLVPWPNMDSYMNALNPLKDQIYNSNLQTMKDAGITYFTSERLPVNVGDKTTLSLQKMLDMKLLVPFTDRNGNSCDVKASYVSLEKKETEYLMKVNLKCGEEEDYILVHLGCYSYCDGAICEKQNNKEKPTTTPKPKDNIKTPKATVSPTPDPTETPKMTYKCKFVGGQYWGKNSVVVSETTYRAECLPQPTPSEKEYEYKKEISTFYEKVFGQWTAWKTHAAVDATYLPYVNTGTYEREDLGINYVKTGTKDAVIEKVVITKPIQAQITTAKYNVCTEREYVIEREYTVKRTETEYVVEYTGGYQLVEVSGGYQATDTYWSGSNPPADTASIKWVIAGVNFNKCDDCVNNPYTVWREYKRTTGGTYKLANDPTTTSDTVTSADTSVTERVLSSGCSQTEVREIPVYINRIKTETKEFVKEQAQDIYEWKHLYRDRSRELIRDSYTDTKAFYAWSTYNDLSLLNSGYVYTGVTRPVTK